MFEKNKATSHNQMSLITSAKPTASSTISLNSEG